MGIPAGNGRNPHFLCAKNIITHCQPALLLNYGPMGFWYIVNGRTDGRKTDGRTDARNKRKTLFSRYFRVFPGTTQRQFCYWRKLPVGFFQASFLTTQCSFSGICWEFPGEFSQQVYGNFPSPVSLIKPHLPVWFN